MVELPLFDRQKSSGEGGLSFVQFGTQSFLVGLDPTIVYCNKPYP
jgi:hypothetical protein